MPSSPNRSEVPRYGGCSPARRESPARAFPARGRRKAVGRLASGQHIHLHPVQAELTDSPIELFEVDGLDDVAVDAQVVALDDVALFA